MENVMMPDEVREMYEGLTQDEMLAMQVKMAGRVVEEMKKAGDIKEMNAADLLDVLACCGLSLTVSEVASMAYLNIKP